MQLWAFLCFIRKINIRCKKTFWVSWLIPGFHAVQRQHDLHKVYNPEYKESEAVLWLLHKDWDHNHFHKWREKSALMGSKSENLTLDSGPYYENEYLFSFLTRRAILIRIYLHASKDYLISASLLVCRTSQRPPWNITRFLGRIDPGDQVLRLIKQAWGQSNSKLRFPLESDRIMCSIFLESCTPPPPLWQHLKQAAGSNTSIS